MIKSNFILFYFILFTFCSCSNSSHKSLKDSKFILSTELKDTLKSELNRHKFKSFENILVTKGLCKFKIVNKIRYLYPIVKMDSDLQNMIIKYYLLYAYNDDISGIPIFLELEFESNYIKDNPEVQKMNEKYYLGYRNTKNILYGNENLNEIREDWEEIIQLREQYPSNEMIDLMYLISKSAIILYKNDAKLVSDTFNQNDYQYLYNMSFSGQPNSLDYNRVLIKAIQLNNYASETKQVNEKYKEKVKEYYDFSITEFYNFNDSMVVSMDEINRIWKFGNSKDSQVANMLYLNLLIKDKKYDEVYKRSSFFLTPLLSEYLRVSFLEEYKNALIKVGAISLFLQNDFDGYYHFLDTLKYDFKGYDIEERNNFEKFTKDLFIRYYKGNKSFISIIKECYN